MASFLVNTTFLLPLAQVGRPLFGNQWLALAVVLAGVAVFLAAVALLGRWLAATHPAEASPWSPGTAPGSVPSAAPTAQELAVIAAVVVVMLGRRARLKSVMPVSIHAPSVEALMQRWSLEGRRQIYTSHKVR